MDVISSRTISPGDGGINVILILPFILNSKFGKKLYIISRELAYKRGRGFHILIGQVDLHGTLYHVKIKTKVDRSAKRIILHTDFLVIEPEAGCNGQSFYEQVVESRLMSPDGPTGLAVPDGGPVVGEEVPQRGAAQPN